MRNSILGFNQAYATSLYKNVEKNGKETILKLDVNDLTILRWLVDFSHTGKMETISIEHNVYYWVSYNKVIDDLPLLNIGKDMLYRRLKKMVELEILTYYSKAGGQAYFGFGKNYENMISNEYIQNSEGSENNPNNLGKNSEATSEKIPSNNILNNSSLNINNLDKELEKDNKENIIKEVIDYLNSKANTKYKHTTDKTKKCINARLNEGFTIDDFKNVIDIKTTQWLGTEWEQYLRPETLFGPKFESYLNTKPNTYNQSNNQSYTPNQPTKEDGYNYYTENGIQFREKDGNKEYYQYGAWFKYYTPEERAAIDKKSKIDWDNLGF